MPTEIYYKEYFGRRLRKITQAVADTLIKINHSLYTSIGLEPVIDPPVVTTDPSIKGPLNATAVGTTFTVTPGVYDGAPTLTYQWQVNDADEAGETGTTFDSTGLLVGDTVTCVETATNEAGTLDTPSNTIILT